MIINTFILVVDNRPMMMMIKHCMIILFSLFSLNFF